MTSCTGYDNSTEKDEELVRSRVLSVAQDLVYCTSSGIQYIPKHIGLASTMHEATRSKDLLQLFHGAEYCLSYEQMTFP